MMYFIALLILLPLALLGLLVIGLAIYGQRHALNLPLKIILGITIVLPAWIADVILNFLLNFLLWDFQATATITQRLKWYITRGYGWRYEFAMYLRAPINALDHGHLP